MKLTCVTAVFNAIRSGNRERLIRCVESVAALKTEHEHLIYDGASTDGTVDLLRELEREINGEGSGKKVGGESRSTADVLSSSDAERTPRLRVVSEPDTGIYNALNKGVRDAQGEWFYVLGCDDEIVDPHGLASALNVGCATDAEIVSSPVFVSSDRTRLLSPSRNLLFCGGIFPHQGVLMRKSLMQEMGGFDESYKIASDYDLLLRAVLNGCRVSWSDKAYTVYGTSGVSSEAARCYAEYAAVVQKTLKLSETDGKRLVFRKLMPLKTILRLLVHQSPEVRRATHYHAIRFVADLLGLIADNGALRWRAVK